MKRVWVITLFPEYFTPLLQAGIVRRVFQGEKQQLKLCLINPRDFTTDNYQSVDDYVYGGSAGMLMRADILARAVEKGILESYQLKRDQLHIIAPGPRGAVWTNERAKGLANLYQNSQKEVVWVCGRYEGIDERFFELYVDEHLSLGDFILSGGEIATLAMLDSFARFLPGALGHATGVMDESFEGDLLEGVQYTRPPEFAGLNVPEVLVQGNHKKIAAFNLQSREQMTERCRPDLWARYLARKAKCEDEKRKDKKR